MTIEQKSINTVRVLAAETVQKANSGHPGAPMGMAPLAYALWCHTLHLNPHNSAWPDRDRFVLSSGHASSMEYVLLHLCGFDVTMEDLKNFRQFGSRTPGHPEYGHTDGVETTTGPLGQGVANAVGFAMAETILAEHFNREGFPVVDHRTYAVCGDGCLMEGISQEAISLAGTLQLSKLTLLYDDNEISIEGNTDIAFRENVGARFEACGWQVLRVQDGNSYGQVLDALGKAGQQGKPTLIICPTTIGFGCESKQGTASAHGEPLGAENVQKAKAALGITDDDFTVSQDVYDHFAACMQRGIRKNADWNALFERYREAYPDLAEEWDSWQSGEIPVEVLSGRALWAFDGKISTRNASGTILNRLAACMPNLYGGSADLAPSNKTTLKGLGDYSAQNRGGRNLHFGIREHAMAAICNGMALHGGLRVFCATFFVFSDYMKHAMRMTALMQLPVIYILTHDSIGVGEDGATHQPVEQAAALRAIPGFHTFRPADAHETAAAYVSALSSGTPTALLLSRQDLPLFENSDERALRGGYILSDSEKETPDVILMASGSEVGVIMDAQKLLRTKGIDARVVSMPCMEVFAEQDESYRESVLPLAVRARVAMEAASPMPWYRFTGLDGIVLGMDTFGSSGPANVLFKHFGFTPENAAEAAEKLLKR